MILVEQHIIKREHSFWDVCDDLCFKSKNLYNYALYKIKKEYEENKKFLNYNAIEKILRIEEKHESYFALPNNSSQQTLMLLDKNFRSFFAAIRSWKNNKTIFKAAPQPPKFKHKTKGRNIVIFTVNQAKIKDGFVHFAKKSGIPRLKTKVEKFKQIRIIPQASCYVFEILYEKEIFKHEDMNYAQHIAIDLGINNLCAVSSDKPGLAPFLINGRPLKSINHFFNKEKARIQSQLQRNHGKKSSKRLNKLNLKRKNKIDYYLHHVSKMLITYCIVHKIGNIIIGYNSSWKQDVNMGKKTNQNFVQIPFAKLIQMIEYKAKLNSIVVRLQEEAYTSKCSALDCEPIKFHVNYVGSRVKRGLFKHSNGLINADINGSLNILRKATDDSFIGLVSTGDVVSPLKVLPL